MRNVLGLAALATLLIGSTGCYRSARYGYVPTYYGSAQAAVVYQQQPTQVVYQQPAPVVYQQPAQVVYHQQPVYYQQPVVLQTAPQVYYHQPTGYYRRPAIYGGVRVYIAP